MENQNIKQLFLNITLNIVIPVIILIRFSTQETLGPVIGLVVALMFPIGFGLFELGTKKKINFFSAIGLVSILLTGGIGLFQLSPGWVAIKEAGVPFVIGIVIIVSHKTRFPLTKLFIHKVLNMDKIERALSERKKMKEFRRMEFIATLLLGGSFFFSSFLNYMLAVLIVKSPAGTVAFNEELGIMTALSLPVIGIPMFVIIFFIFFFVMYKITQLTDLKVEEIFS